MTDKSYIKKLRKYIFIFLLTDLVFIFLFYIINAEYLKYIITFILIFTLLVLVYIIYFEYSNQKEIKKLVVNFFENPNFETRDNLSKYMGKDWKKIINNIFKDINAKNEELEKKDISLISYREFIEEWTHEIKTPLSISKLILENHPDDLSFELKDRFNYINSSLENSIDKVLFYARSDLEHSDYRMKRIYIREIISQVIEKYYPIISEKAILIRDKFENFEVFSDENVLIFIISQIMDNACKYTDSMIEIRSSSKGNFNHIEIRDNGRKVDDRDLPFIFEKGFTGQISYKQKPTGIGLYLVKRYADDLGIKVEVAANEDKNFSIKLSFTRID